MMKDLLEVIIERHQDEAFSIHSDMVTMLKSIHSLWSASS
jgi:hypothetical protein